MIPLRVFDPPVTPMVVTTVGTPSTRGHRVASAVAALGRGGGRLTSIKGLVVG